MAKQKTLYVSADMDEGLKKLAKEQFTTQSSLIRRALAELLEKHGIQGDWDVDSPGGARR